MNSGRSMIQERLGKASVCFIEGRFKRRDYSKQAALSPKAYY